MDLVRTETVRTYLNEGGTSKAHLGLGESTPGTGMDPQGILDHRERIRVSVRHPAGARQLLTMVGRGIQTMKVLIGLLALVLMCPVVESQAEASASSVSSSGERHVQGRGRHHKKRRHHRKSRRGHKSHKRHHKVHKRHHSASNEL